MKTDTNSTIESFKKYVIPNYIRNAVVLTRGKGMYLWDSEGKRYLDLFSGWAVSNLGHCHPRVTSALSRQAKTLVHAPNIFYTEAQGALAKLISDSSFGGMCFFCNSGAEANEAAIKLARIHYSPQDRYKIITMHNSFHGRTMAALAATAQPKYHKGFSPMLEGFTFVPFDDLDAVKEAIDDKTCGVMLEPIQGEGGVNIPSREYLKGLRRLCDEHRLLLILDEVQSGMGRTGKYFAYQHYRITPDVMTLAKSLGNGTAIGAMTARAELAKSLVPGSHATTFGGNPLACAAGVAVFDTIRIEGLLDNCSEMGAYSMERLNSLAERFGDLVKEVRGVGLMIGIELKKEGMTVVKRCMEKGLLLNCTQEKVIRFMPPLNVGKKHIDEGIAILEGVLKEYQQE